MNESQCKIHKKCKFFYNSIHEGFNNTADSAKFSHQHQSLDNYDYRL